MTYLDFYLVKMVIRIRAGTSWKKCYDGESIDRDWTRPSVSANHGLCSIVIASKQPTIFPTVVLLRYAFHIRKRCHMNNLLTLQESSWTLQDDWLIPRYRRRHSKSVVRFDNKENVFSVLNVEWEREMVVWTGTDPVFEHGRSFTGCFNMFNRSAHHCDVVGSTQAR